MKKLNGVYTIQGYNIEFKDGKISKIDKGEVYASLGDMTFDAEVIRNGLIDNNIKLENYWHVEAFDKFGIKKWEDSFANLITTAGLNDILTQYLKGSGYTAAWYIGLTAGTPSFNAADTMASHAGWTEVTAYDEAVRQTLTLGTAAAGSIDNSASKGVFTISTNSTTVGGAFIVTDSTKGGTSGTLYGGAAFTAGDKSLDDDDVLNVTVTLTAASA